MNIGNVYWVLLGFYRLNRFLLSIISVNWVLPSFFFISPYLTRFYRVFIEFSSVYWILLGFVGFLSSFYNFSEFN